MSLPRFIVLESLEFKKYVNFVEKEGGSHGLLRSDGEKIVSPCAKFEVERGRSDSNHFHIRCCYNNRYLTQRYIAWIACDANRPEENTSLPTCTLFEPVFTSVDNQNCMRLKFVFSGLYVNASNSDENPLLSCLTFSSSAMNRGLFTVVDWESLLILPKYVAFKGDNGQFLSARTIERHPYLQFTSNDIGDPTVGNEVFTQRDGSIRLKSNHFRRFWRRSPNWIWADSDDTTHDNLDTVFWPVRVSSNVVALRNLGNNNFCKSLTTEGKTNCLNAAVPTIARDARLEVHETVLLRDISNVKFRLLDARIYGEAVLAMATGDAVNRTTQPNSITLRFMYSEKESRSFNSSVTLKLGVETTIKTGIPIISEGKITIAAQFEGTVEWGSTSETHKEMETTYTVLVPAMTALKVRLLATQGKCDVPFSYTQRDTLANGQIATIIMNDGVYTGVNCFNFTYETDEQPLSLNSQPTSPSQLSTNLPFKCVIF